MTPARLDRRRGIAGAVLIAGWAARSSRPHSGAPRRRQPGAQDARRYTPRTMPQGTAIVIGGAEDKVRDRLILSRFVALAGGPGRPDLGHLERIVAGAVAGETYKRVFTELGASEVWPIHAITRAQANDEPSARSARLDRRVHDRRQPAAPVVHDRRHAPRAGDPGAPPPGSVIAGTSAGASAMSSHMVAFGATGGTPKQRMVQMAAGLGLLPSVIVDQHFQQRNRLGRLLATIAQNPSLLGLGIDEDTAGVVGPDLVMEVIGRAS